MTITARDIYNDYVSLCRRLDATPLAFTSFKNKAAITAACNDAVAALDELAAPVETRIVRSLTKTERARLRRHCRDRGIHPHGARWNSHDLPSDLLALLSA